MLLTIFTPTYNRSYTLPVLYESLVTQSCLDFEWLIIDDGSTDDTKRLIDSWILQNKIKITYFYKVNEGMHSAHNKAFELITTDFNMCIDSDDFVAKDAIEKIYINIKNLPKHCAGIIGLDADKNGSIIGTKIPEHLEYIKLNELYSLHKVKGDKKMVYRTEIVKLYPSYPVFNGERFVPLDYLFLLIDQDYDLKVVNEIFCVVEYLDDGSTNNIYKQYRINPNGFAFSRVSRINLAKTFNERFKNAIHLVSSSIFSKRYSWIFSSKKNVLVFMAIPFGIALNLFIRYKTK